MTIIYFLDYSKYRIYQNNQKLNIETLAGSDLWRHKLKQQFRCEYSVGEFIEASISDRLRLHRLIFLLFKCF
ncbi:MAG: hypothetical protein QNJ47_09960 [Nostocaceae cyanobacterium]|nr:hypothetical protein [Nostocaceae cyanobacterium]